MDFFVSAKATIRTGWDEGLLLQKHPGKQINFCFSVSKKYMQNQNHEPTFFRELFLFLPWGRFHFNPDQCKNIPLNRFKEKLIYGIRFKCTYSVIIPKALRGIPFYRIIQWNGGLDNTISFPMPPPQLSMYN